MSEKVMDISCPVKRLTELIDILISIERVGGYDDWESISISGNSGTVIGTNVTGLQFQLNSLGYDTRSGPVKTHLFINYKE